MTEAEKTKYQKRSAYVVWHLKKYLPKSILDDEAERKAAYLDSNSSVMNNENNLIAVQIMSKQAVLSHIEKLEKEYDAGKIDRPLKKIQRP